MNTGLLILIMLGALVLGGLAIGISVFFLQRYLNPEPTALEIRLARLRGLDLKNKRKETKTNRFIRESIYKNEKLGLALERYAFFQHLKALLQQANSPIPPDVFVIRNLVLPAFICLVLAVVTGFPPLYLLSGVSIAGNYGWLIMKRHQRYAKFVAQMPDALMLITSSLRAGHSFQAALSVASSELSDPIGTELTALVKDINLGLPVRDSLLRLVDKMDNMPDVAMFSTAVSIQREAGGNLAEVLETLGNTIRERFKLKRQISSLTAQSRITGYVLGAAPTTLLLGLTLFMYSYVQPLYETSIGHVALGVALVLQLIGFMVMNKIINIRI